jgi:short-subunit dehydrogenase
MHQGICTQLVRSAVEILDAMEGEAPPNLDIRYFMTTKTVALITGANKGLGLEIARQLGKQGLVVVLGARDQAKGAAAVAELRKQDIDAHAVKLDVTTKTTWRRCPRFSKTSSAVSTCW